MNREKNKTNKLSPVEIKTVSCAEFSVEDISIKQLVRKGKLPIDEQELKEQALLAFKKLEQKKAAGTEYLAELLETASPKIQIKKI